MLVPLALAPIANAEPGFTREIWQNIPGSKLSDFTSSPRYWQTAESVSTFTGAIAPSNVAENFASRVRAFVIAPITGEYTFWIASDDEAELRLSSTASKFGAIRIASVSGYVAPQAWDKKASQKSGRIHLEAGKSYFIEALHKEGGSADHLAIAWQIPGGSRELIPASSLESFTADANDADNDGLRDDWEAAHGFSLTDNGTANTSQHPLADPDHDGYSNLEESEYGTDPKVRGGVPGLLSLEIWTGISGGTVRDLTWSPLFNAAPNLSEFVDSAATPVNRADKYGARLRGYVIAPASGDYTFHLSGDDSCELWLSPSANQFDKERVATVEGQTSVAQWTKYASQKSRTISLLAGQKCYLEALVKEAAGGDHLEIGWKKPGDTAIQIIPGSALESYAYDADDADGDNLPDTWENANGLDSVRNDASEDPDRDGIPNSLEYANASNPQVKNPVPGALLTELWTGIPGYSVKELKVSPKFLQDPEKAFLITSTQTDSQPYDAFGLRARGYITAPATGIYTFWVVGDDETELWLSNTASPFDKQLLVRPTLNTSNFDTDISQRSRQVQLVAGQRYYVEILHKDYYSKDFCRIAWTKLGTAREIIPGSVLSSYVPIAEDQDDDGLPDAWETANGLDPQDNGRYSPANGANGDLDGDGLTNAAEWKAGTKANAADSDGDGVSDREEQDLLGSDSLVQDTAPFESLAILPGDSYSSASGAWSSDRGSAVQGDVRGWLEYSIEILSAGIHRIDCGFTPTGEVAGERSYEFAFFVDGAALQRISAPSRDGVAATASILSPWLAAGSHTLRVLVDNPHKLRHVAVNQVAILAARGADANGNGIPEWIEAKLAQRNSLDSFASSRTSPVSIEGRGRWPELIRVAGLTPQAAPNDRWYADVALAATGATTIVADLENGAVHREIAVEWTPTNLLAENDLVVRAGDALLLTAFTGTTGSPDEAITLAIDGGSALSTTADASVRVDFPAAGTQTITVTHVRDGQTTRRTVPVNVVAAPVIGTPAFLVGHDRELDIPELGNGVTFALDQRVSVRDSTPITGGHRYTLLLDTLEDRTGLYRLGAGGPVLGTVPLHAMRVRDAAETGIYYCTDLGNNTWDVETPVIADGLREDVTLRYEIFIGGVTFDNGMLQKELAVPANFDGDQSTLLHFYKVGISGSNCHRLSVWQSGKRIAYRQ